MRIVSGIILLGSTTALVGVASSCDREKRAFHVPPAAADAPEAVEADNVVRAGGWEQGKAATGQTTSLTRVMHEPYKRQYPNNAQALSDGQTLFAGMNCTGCHANGGGGIGPPLIDNKWFYGGEPEDIYKTIAEGRPNGMPAFKGRIPDYQMWELVAYVRSMSGFASKQAAPGREDHMRVEQPPNSTSPKPIKNVPDGMATAPPSTTTTAPTTQPGK